MNWLNPADQSPLETTIGFEQVAIEVTASVVMAEPDPYMAQVYRFGLLEDFDHLYRYEAVHVAELSDNDCWPPLLELLVNGGYESEAQRFLCAVQSEREHLQCVRMWLAAAQGRSIEDVRTLSEQETAAVMASPAIAPLVATDDQEAQADAWSNAAGRARKRAQPMRAARRSRGGKRSQAGSGRSTAAKRRVAPPRSRRQ